MTPADALRRIRACLAHVATAQRARALADRIQELAP